ncbi:SDR family oxidoreductase [Bacillus sp. B15-48]|uniref:SDR family NAD(P)-dependent oxidoreductase n=1 Tax=Bacillus sp. B15-48 TaxID=1548601 RepID=UPI00193F6585|nr:SDR family oxidoreductase [Bacillus sp. B15-48]MBM4763659.1 SDR family oxidoreductase [Bacillus sp. B15-48]
MLLEKKRIIVTGGASGMAASTVRAYAKEGAHVFSLDILDEQGQKLAEEATDQGPGVVHYLHCDVSKRDEVRGAFESAVSKLGGLDVLVSAAGVNRIIQPEDLTENDIDFIFGVNVYGTMYANQEAFKYMKDNGGKILNFASVAGMNPYPAGAHYSATKGAVASWTRSIAHAWGTYQITVNSLAPAVWTPMYEERRTEFTSEELKAHDEAYAKAIPIGGKLGDPDKDFVPVMVFLAGEGARFITGQIIPVDGGLASTR